MRHTSTFEFLSLVLPDEGWRCLWTLPDRHHYWFDDLAAMAAAALRLDGEGKAVYCAMASFNEKKRTQAHVRGLRDYWFDVDCGQGKPYPAGPAALGAVEAFRRAAGLPGPLYVGTGSGLHVHFPLRAALSRERWQRGADELRALAQRHGLEIDPGVTIDSARVLRAPGTHNYKLLGPDGKKLSDVGGPARPVRWAGPVERIDGEALMAQLGAVAPTVSRETLSLEAGLDNVTPAGGKHDDADPELITAACPQVSLLRDSAGNISEPLWYAVLGVLGHCGEIGRSLAHAFSAGDPRYSAQDTDRKLDHAVSASGPTTCRRFELLNASTCLGCAYRGKVTSPIQLGRSLPAATLAERPQEKFLPDLPHPFFWKHGKLMMHLDDPEKPQDVTVAEYPVFISQLQKQERGEAVSAVFRSWEPAAGAWTDFSLGLKEVTGDKGLANVAEHGVVFDKKKWPLFASLVVKQVNEHRGTRLYGVRYDQFGWKEGGGFVIGDELRLKGEIRHAYGSLEVERRAKMLRPRGELKAWRQAAEKLFRHAGMEGHGFALLSSFAAPLFSMASPRGGALVHLRSMDTGKGKTAALDAAASVWGEKDAVNLNSRDTQVSKFIVMGVLCHLPVIYDELRDPDPQVVKDFVLLFTGGRDKMRGAEKGGIRSDHLPWATIVLSASNISLVDTVRHDGEEAHAARVFEFSPIIPEAARLPVAEGDALLSVLDENRGNAGRAFVDAVLKDPAGVREMVSQALRHYSQVLDGTDMRFTVRLFACVAVAGLLCRKHGILDLPVESIMQWALAEARGAQAQRSGTVDPAQVLGAMLNDLLPSTLVAAGSFRRGATPTPPLHAPSRDLCVRREQDSGKVYVTTAAARRWLQQKNYSFTEIERALLEMKIIVNRRDKKTLGAGSVYGNEGQVLVWAIDGRHAALQQEAEEAPVDNVVPMRRA